MNYIPKKVRELFIKIFEQFSNTKDIGYKDVILGMAETEDEKKDLEELFHSTTDYYNEYQKVAESGKEPSEYLFEFYMEEWKKENPNATVEEKNNAVKEFEEILEQGVLNATEALDKDGKLRRLLEKKTRSCDDETDREGIVDQQLEELHSYEMNSLLDSQIDKNKEEK